MEEFCAETETTSTRLLNEMGQLHSDLTFCGKPRNAILTLSDDLLSYVLSLLKDEPIYSPQVSITQWTELFRILKPHWIVPLLYWHVGRLPDEFRPPEPILDGMRTRFQWSRTRCFHMERQLGEILGAFKEKGVRALVLKGPALGRTVYPDPALRPGSDLDLLVRPEQFIKAREIFKKAGYRCESELFEIYKNFHCEEDFTSRANSRVIRSVCLHWDVHDFFGKKRGNRAEEFFQKAVEIDAANLSFEAMHQVDALILAALHLIMTHNQDMRLIWIYDIALLARNLVVPEDWEILKERSLDCGARLAVEKSLRLAQILTGLQLPRRFSDFSTWPKPAEAELTCMTNAMVKRGNPKVLFKLHLSSSPELFKRVRYFCKLILPGPDYMQHHYGRSNGLLLPLSHARRWWKWVRNLAA